MSTLDTVLLVAASIGSGLSLILHAVASHTKTTLDDRVAEFVDQVLTILPKPAGEAVAKAVSDVKSV